MPENKGINKADLLAYLQSLVREKLDLSMENYRAAQESVHGEDKSSAGDKHETGRAMAQIEWEKAGNVVREQQNMLDALKQLEKITALPVKAALGSLIETESAYFFLSVGLGALQFNEKTVYAIGTKAPLGAQLLGKSKGDSFPFNGTNLTILALY